MKKIVWLAAAFCTMSAITTAAADETGLAGIHDWRKEGARTCLSDHFHDGAGVGPNRKAAEANAIASWSSFTVLEYGTNWGAYGLAASKKMDCTQDFASQWSCDVTARPCKGAQRVVSPAKRGGAAGSQARKPAKPSSLTVVRR